MTSESQAIIRAAFLAGATTEDIAAAAGVSEDDAELYLMQWCGEGCPEGG